MPKQKNDATGEPPKQQSEAARKHQWWKRALFGLMLLFIFVGAISGATSWFYQARALPGVQLGDIDLKQKTLSEIRQIVAAQQAVLSVTFVNDGTRVTVPAKDLGVALNVDATAKQVLQAKRANGLLRGILSPNVAHVPLVLTSDAGMLKAYMAQHFSSVFVDPTDARLAYNQAAQQFDIQNGTMGKGFDIQSFESRLPDLAAHPRNFTLTLATLPVKPLIPASGLVGPQQTVNQQLKQPLQFTLGNQTIYTATPADIANWVQFVPDTTKGTVSIDYDKAKIQQFLDQPVSPIIATPPQDRKVIIDQASGSQVVVSEGHEGQQIQDTDKLAADVLNALNAHQSLTKEVTVATAPFKTVTVSGSGKWIEIDLTHQRATLYVGNEVVNSFLISSGIASHPTRTGVFAVWLKVPEQTMTGGSAAAGDYYYLPGVKWVSYFDEDRAMHGTYWHHNFGHPMSHGCINMTNDAAKIVYDFAPVGTKVVVHD